MRVSLCILLLLLETRLVFSDNNTWIPISWESVQVAEPGDVIDVWYLLAPLLEENFGDFGQYVNLYHGAIAFNNSRTGVSYTLNYDANDFFRNSLFPLIVEYPNGTRDLVWDNGGASFIYEGIDSLYWYAGQYRVANINGSAFNKYITQWLPTVNGSQPYYDMFSVVDAATGKFWITSYDCFDFVWQSFRILYGENGTLFDYSVNISRNFITIYGEAPMYYTTLFDEDPAIREQVIDFYAFIQAKYSDLSVSEFIDTFIAIVLQEVFYLRQSTDYWKTNLADPFIGVHFDVAPLPGQ